MVARVKRAVQEVDERMAITPETLAPARGNAFDAATLGEAFRATAAEHAQRVALRAPAPGTDLTWGRYAEEVHRAATALHKLGLTAGDALALMLTNRVEFHVIDTAALNLGVTTFSVYNTFSPDQIRYIT